MLEASCSPTQGERVWGALPVQSTELHHRRCSALRLFGLVSDGCIEPRTVIGKTQEPASNSSQLAPPFLKFHFSSIASFLPLVCSSTISFTAWSTFVTDLTMASCNEGFKISQAGFKFRSLCSLRSARCRS